MQTVIERVISIHYYQNSEMLKPDFCKRNYCHVSVKEIAGTTIFDPNVLGSNTS